MHETPFICLLEFSVRQVKIGRLPPVRQNTWVTICYVLYQSFFYRHLFSSGRTAPGAAGSRFDTAYNSDPDRSYGLFYGRRRRRDAPRQRLGKPVSCVCTKNYPGTEVINLARGGYSTYHLMPGQAAWPPAGRPMPDTARNITKALSLRPNAIILNLPSNDAAAGYALEEQLANFDTIVQSSRRAGVPIWVGSTQPRHFSAAKIWIQLLARDSILEKYGAFAVNFWDDVAEPNGLIQWQTNSGDGIHLNNTGHRLLFERIREKNILPYRIKE
ncbi:MAG: SGNH/GDSL hydrolase family protein [Saprospirales bacterium]|nr:SGNH/GDSL hydrolase family protein [Saprospirales bacterium]